MTSQTQQATSQQPFTIPAETALADLVLRTCITIP
jgi:hypothetical protein